MRSKESILGTLEGVSRQGVEQEGGYGYREGGLRERWGERKKGGGKKENVMNGGRWRYSMQEGVMGTAAFHLLLGLDGPYLRWDRLHN